MAPDSRKPETKGETPFERFQRLAEKVVRAPRTKPLPKTEKSQPQT